MNERKTGALSQEEKYLAIGMYLHGIAIGDIKRRLNRDRSSQVVDKYIAKFVNIDKPMSEEEGDGRSYTDLVKPIPTDIQYDKAAVLSKLDQAGIRGEDATHLIAKALSKFKNRKTVEAKELYNEAMRNIGARELMLRQTNNGEKGVVTMTEAASNMGQNLHQQARQHQPDYVFHVKSPNREM